VGEALPGGVEVVEPEGPLLAVLCRDGIEGCVESIPECTVFGLGRGVLFRFVALAWHREQGLGAQGGERVAPVETGGRVSGGRGLIEPDLFEQAQLPGLKGGAAAWGLAFDPVLAGVVFFEFFPLETRGDPVGGGDDPLQEGLRPVVHRGSIDQGVGGFALPLARGKGENIAMDEIGYMLFDTIEHQRRPGGMAVAVVAAFVKRAIQGEVGIELLAIHAGEGGAFGKFAQVMQQGGKGDAAGGIE